MHAFETGERSYLTDQEKAELFLQRRGRCHRCQRKLGPSDWWMVEHVLALQNGGTNDWKNLDVTCEWCVKDKNREDQAIAAKGRRRAVKHLVPKDQRRKKWRW